MADLISLILPKRCVFCGAPHPGGFCGDCGGKLPWRKPPGLDGVIAPLFYKSSARFALHRFKFRGFSGYAPVFAALMAQAVRDCGAEADTVAWIPCGIWRRWTRGYDQSRLLAKAAAKALSLPHEKLLIKVKRVKSQTKMPGDAERHINVKGVFKALPAARGKRIFLIDDIYTSGATLNQASGVLKSAGAAEVIPCAVAARENKEWKK
jgi:ComF family protein